MDLGFGSSNQIIGNSAASSILRATAAQEEAIVSEITKYDALLSGNNDTELERLRERRLQQMKSAATQRTKWIEAGHGTYEELNSSQNGGDVAKAFFDVAKKSSRCVIHFYRPTTRMCDVFHRALSDLAPKHLETKFVKINVEGCDDVREGGSGVGSKYLVEKLGVVVMPTLLIVKDRKAVHQLRGFDELGGTMDFSVNELAYVLGGHGALTRRDEEDVPPRFTEEGALLANSGGGGGRASSSSSMMGVNSLRMKFGGGNYNGPRSGGYDDFDDDA